MYKNKFSVAKERERKRMKERGRCGKKRPAKREGKKEINKLLMG